MPTEPEIKLLSYERRSRFFLVLLTIFLVSLPIFIFYTSGYRFNFSEQEIVTTGGIYITTNNLDVDVYMDEEHVERPRLFRSAYYIQNIAAGLHRVVVQKEGLHTWVKELPVESHIVSEAAAFNMPVLPHIRVIPEFKTPTGENVYFAESTSTLLFPKATTSDDLLILTRRGTTTLAANAEYEYVASLFATSSASSTSILNRLEAEIERFRFATATDATTSELLPEIFIEQGNMRLVERDNELFARWIGAGNATPYYFCAPIALSSSTVAVRFGEHFAKQIEEQRLSTTTPLHVEGDRVCRTEIRLDRKWQQIKYYEFFPNSSDLVILQLEDGLYVTEIDDRSWQNTQMIYPGDNFRTVVTDTNIYIEEDGNFFELLTKIEEED
ncbi:MAG TPA: hypothetical protein VGE31_00860 [Candidatus Paceibacterota bacterium]